MPSIKSCYVCKHTKAMDPGVHFHGLRQEWMEALNIEEGDLPRIYSHRFLDDDASKMHSLTLGNKFASPLKIPGPHWTALPANRQK